MQVETVSTDEIAVCPGCGNAMHFARAGSPVGQLSALQTFECRPCGLSITGEAVLEICREWRPSRLTSAYSRKSTGRPCLIAPGAAGRGGHLSRTSIADYARAKKIVRGLGRAGRKMSGVLFTRWHCRRVKRYGDPWRLNDDEPPWTGPGPPPSSMRGRS